MLLIPGCIDKIYSVSVVIGSEACPASCAACGGKRLAHPTRSDALRTIIPAARLALSYGAWTLSITGQGEPTLDTEQITELLTKLKENNLQFPFVNLFSNCIPLNTHPEKYDKLLRQWRDLGLTSVVLSIHSVYDDTNKRAYGSPDHMCSRQHTLNQIKETGLTPRVTLLLQRGYVDDAQTYKYALQVLCGEGIRMVTSWPIVDYDGSRIQATPSRLGLAGIKWWLIRNTEPVMGHVWGGMVRAYQGMNVRITDYVTDHKQTSNFLRQLVVLPDGTVSYSWHQSGMHCLY